MLLIPINRKTKDKAIKSKSFYNCSSNPIIKTEYLKSIMNLIHELLGANEKWLFGSQILQLENVSEYIIVLSNTASEQLEIC